MASALSAGYLPRDTTHLSGAVSPGSNPPKPWCLLGVSLVWKEVGVSPGWFSVGTEGMTPTIFLLLFPFGDPFRFIPNIIGRKLAHDTSHLITWPMYFLRKFGRILTRASEAGVPGRRRVQKRLAAARGPGDRAARRSSHGRKVPEFVSEDQGQKPFRAAFCTLSRRGLHFPYPLFWGRGSFARH